MASEIRVDKINSLSGVGTVTLSPTGVDISGITTVSTLKVGTGVTASSDGDIFFTGIATATTFSGSGANLTALPAASLTGTVADARFPATLPAISALNLTNVPAANVVGVHTSLTVTNATTTGTAVVGSGVTISESGIEASGIGITVANINGTQIGGRRNIIINGAMQITQRGTSTSSWTGLGFPACDRQKTLASYGGTWTISQSTEAPSDNGFTKSTKYDCTTANTSLNSASYLQHYYRIEGQDLQGVCKGTSGAKALTLSFWVKTNKTGTYNVEAIDQDNSRLCTFSYTVSDTNWNKYVITFPADTTGAFGNDNGASLDIGWWLVAGTSFSSGSNQNTFGSFTQANRAPSNVNLADSTSNEWYITGIQLELGSEATAFEHRSFGEELALCQRYYYMVADGRDSGSTKQLSTGMAYSNNQVEAVIHYPVMRSNPSLVQGSGTDYFKAINGNNSDTFNNYILYHPSPRAALIYRNQLSVTEGQSYRLEFNENDAYIHLSAEL